MCFSATGSFTAAALLTGIGATALARNDSRSHRLFAAIPLMFAAQQAAEGVVWLTFDRPGLMPLQHIAVLAFLGCALAVWPVWVPLSLRRMEREPGRRRLLDLFVLAGVAVAAVAVTLLVRGQPVPRVVAHSIRYLFAEGSVPLESGVYLAGYIVPTVLAFFVSSASLTRLTGVALMLSLAISVVIERDALTSVWCFFAALLSGLVMLVVAREQRFLVGAPAARRAAIAD